MGGPSSRYSGTTRDSDLALSDIEGQYQPDWDPVIRPLFVPQDQIPEAGASEQNHTQAPTGIPIGPPDQDLVPEDVSTSSNDPLLGSQ